MSCQANYHSQYLCDRALPKASSIEMADSLLRELAWSIEDFLYGIKSR